MENSPFRQKIEKQHQIVLRQIFKFNSVFEGKTIQPTKVQNYCNFISFLSTLHQSYVHNCMQYFTPLMKSQMLRINKTIIQDLIKKLKHFSQQKQYFQTNIEKPCKKQVCQLCNTKVREIDVKIIKEKLADDAYERKSLLKKIYSDLENQHADLYSKDQDQVFFTFLNRILIKKQQVLSMQTKQINDFLVEVTKSFSDLNFLTQYTPVKLSPHQYKQNYKQQLQKSLTQSLKHNFQQKIPAWIQKVFNKLKKILFLHKKLNLIDQNTQTSNDQLTHQQIKKRSQYACNANTQKQLQSLKHQIQQNLESIEQLKNKLTITQRQKKQLQQYYTKQIEQVLIGKRKIELELKKTQKQISLLKLEKNNQINVLKKTLMKKKGDKMMTGGQNQLKEQAEIQNNGGVMLEQPGENDSIMKNTATNGLNSTIGEEDMMTSTLKRKKKNQLNKLINKKSQIVKQPLINVQEVKKIDQKDSKEEMVEGIDREEILVNQKKQQQLKTTKNKGKKKKVTNPRNSNNNPTNPPTNRDSIISKKQLNSSKVQFLLRQSIQQQSKQCLISLTNQPLPTQTNTFQSQINDTIQISPSNSSGIPYQRKLKRLLSIQTKINPSLPKQFNQSIYKKQYNQSIIGQQKQSLKTNKAIKIQQKKKIFQFVPLENQQEYQQIRDKLNQVTSKIQLRNTERLKASVKNIKINDNQKLFGFSIFNKKASQQENNGIRKTSPRVNNISKGKIGFKQDQILDKQMSEVQGLIEQLSTRKRFTKDGNSRENKAKSNEKSVGMQTSFKQINESQNQNKLFQTNEKWIKKQDLFSQIPQQQRNKLFQDLKQQSVIPASISFQHYQLLIRKLFSQRNHEFLFHPSSHQQSHPYKQRHFNSITSSNLPTPNYPHISIFQPNINIQNSHTSRQKQSIKINIDSKLLDQPNKLTTNTIMKHPNNNKGLLNLPKLNQNSHNLNRSSMSIYKSAYVTKRDVNSGNSDGLEKENGSEKENNIHSQLKVQNCNIVVKPVANKSPKKLSQPHQYISHTTNSPQPLPCFNQKDLSSLFGSQISAYQYQQNSKNNFKSYHQSQTPKYKFTQPDKQIITSLFLILNQIKQKNHIIYHKICSFVKYPYQTIKNDFDFINITKDVSFQSWVKYLHRIYNMNLEQKLVGNGNHSGNNNSSPSLGFKQFIKPFEQKLVELLILSNNN